MQRKDQRHKNDVVKSSSSFHKRMRQLACLKKKRLSGVFIYKFWVKVVIVVFFIFQILLKC